jgi:glycerate 2-kinase
MASKKASRAARMARDTGLSTILWPGVVNRDRLLDHGPSALRRDAVDIIEAGIKGADPYLSAKQMMSLEGDYFRVNELTLDLRAFDHIYVLGAGKATQGVALALEDILGERITAGLVTLKRGEQLKLRRVKAIHAGHPLPDRDSLRAGRALAALARRAGERDLVFAAITGGSSSLAVSPVEGVSLEELRKLNQLLLTCGAGIREINAVRKHLSRIKGGRLGLKVFPALLVNLTVSDVIGDPLDYITDLTVPDTSTVADARRTLREYALWEAVPESVRRYLQGWDGIETPKTYDREYHTVVVVPGDAAAQAALSASERLGYSAQILSLGIEGESHGQGVGFVHQADGLVRSCASGLPSAIIGGGETTVTLKENEESLKGGPNQVFALGAAQAIAGRQDAVVAAVDTDGTDGPTDAAGGLVDGWTLARAGSIGLDAEVSLRLHESGLFLESANDLVITGPTGTNVNNLMLMLVGRAGSRGPESQA